MVTDARSVAIKTNKKMLKRAKKYLTQGTTEWINYYQIHLSYIINKKF